MQIVHESMTTERMNGDRSDDNDVADKCHSDATQFEANTRGHGDCVRSSSFISLSLLLMFQTFVIYHKVRFRVGRKISET